MGKCQKHTLLLAINKNVSNHRNKSRFPRMTLFIQSSLTQNDFHTDVMQLS